MKRRTVLVSGRVAGVPGQGGAAWAVLQYVLGLRRLGHDVYLVEPVSAATLRPAEAALAASEQAAYLEALAAAFALQGKVALLLLERPETVGVTYGELVAVAGRADLLINLSGILQDPEIADRIPLRLYVDLDPGFTQLWHEAGIDVGFDGHTHFATVGLALGDPECPIPTCGREWIGTLQPVMLAEWPAATRVERDAFTSVANWRSYGSIEHAGVFYGQKAHAFRELAELPTLTDARFELALAIDPGEVGDLALLRDRGWHLLDPLQAAGTPERYRRFIAGSKAEIGVAKSGYLAARCAWFSDRSACYLASGRPVVAQDTGFGRFLPTEKGLLPFAGPEEAVVGIEAVSCDYGAHAAAARQLAEEHFASDRVLGSLLARVGVA